MTDPFYSPKRTLDRARLHIADFQAKMIEFSEGQYWTYVIERDPRGISNKHFVKFDRRFFENLCGVAFDVANNLRSTLDQTAYSTAIAAGKTKPKRAYFPMASSAQDLNNAIRKRCADLRPEIVALFKSFHPYAGGNIWLAALNALCNTQKHAALVPFKTDQHQVTYVQKGMTLGLHHRWNQQKFELELLGVGGADFSKAGGQFVFGLSFDHDEPVIGGSDPLGLLSGAAIQVERVLTATNAECKRLGLM